MNINMNEVVGKDDILFITLDTLRYDVANRAYEKGSLPNLVRMDLLKKDILQGILHIQHIIVFLEAFYLLLAIIYL